MHVFVLLLNLLRVLLLLLHHMMLLKVELLLHRMWNVWRGLHMLLMMILLRMRDVWKLLLWWVWIRRNRLAWCRWSRGPRSLRSYRSISGWTRNASTGTWRPSLSSDHAWLRTVDAKLRVVAGTVASRGATILWRTPWVIRPHPSHRPLTNK